MSFKTHKGHIVHNTTSCFLQAESHTQAANKTLHQTRMQLPISSSVDAKYLNLYISHPAQQLQDERQPAADLDKIGREALPPVGVKVGDGSGHAGRGNAVSNGQSHYLAPALLALHQLGSEEGVHQQVLQVDVTLVGGLDVIQEACADDAAALQTPWLCTAMLSCSCTFPRSDGGLRR